MSKESACTQSTPSSTEGFILSVVLSKIVFTCPDVRVRERSVPSAPRSLLVDVRTLIFNRRVLQNVHGLLALFRGVSTVFWEFLLLYGSVTYIRYPYYLQLFFCSFKSQVNANHTIIFFILLNCCKLLDRFYQFASCSDSYSHSSTHAVPSSGKSL